MSSRLKGQTLFQVTLLFRIEAGREMSQRYLCCQRCIIERGIEKTKCRIIRRKRSCRRRGRGRRNMRHFLATTDPVLVSVFGKRRSRVKVPFRAAALFTGPDSPKKRVIFKGRWCRSKIASTRFVRRFAITVIHGEKMGHAQRPTSWYCFSGLVFSYIYTLNKSTGASPSLK